MAYLVAWYRDWWNEQEKGRLCIYAGHTHVGTFVDAGIAAKAFKIQLDTVIEQIMRLHNPP